MAIEIFIGSQIEHESERVVLEKIARVFEQSNQPAIVLANLNLSGRQLDFVVVLDHLTLLIEAKRYSRSVRGGTNGQWQLRLASGQWKGIDNPYLQALGGKNALRDAMRDFIGADVAYYPSATVVFSPVIPNGSTAYSGDFKVSVVGLNNLESELSKWQSGCWSLEQWRAFARHHSLTPISTVSAACNPVLLKAEQLISQYVNAYSQLYGPLSTELIDYTCRTEGTELTSSDIAHQISEGGADILLSGPSGCGKSLLAARVGVTFVGKGGVPVTIPAKDFQGNLKNLMDQEASLLTAPSAISLLTAARKLGRPVLLIVDGYNECQEGRRALLTRGVAALSRRFDLGILITSQISLARADLLALREVNALVPDRATKSAIALRASAGKLLLPGAEALLDSVGSGLEASLVGDVGRQVNADASRFGLFDAFARKRLGNLAGDGIRALSLVAAWLSDRITFGMSVRDLDRLVESERIPTSLLHDLISLNLITSRGDRISFGHELFLNAFVSESVIRRAAKDSAKILAALSNPRHADRREMIIGAIDDDSLLIQVLEQCHDAKVVASCLSGACGRVAREWAEARYPSLLARIEKEASQIRFVIANTGWWGVDIDPESYESWSPADMALIYCLPDLVASGKFLNEMLNIVASMDRRIEKEFLRLREEARQSKIDIRGAMFGASYVMQRPDAPGVTLVSSRLFSGLFGRNVCKGLAKEMRLAMVRSELTFGQIHLLTALSKLDGERKAPFITWAIKKYWSKAPYHLRMELVDAARYCGNAEEADRNALVEVIEGLPEIQNPFFNTLIFEALHGLGALESSEQEHEGVVLGQIEEILTAVDDQEKCSAAHHIFLAQFDHPYSGAYWEAVQNLPDEKRKKFLMMAAVGASDTHLFLPILILDLAAFGDPVVGNVIRRWTELPKRDGVSPQEAVEVFVMTHISLGRLVCTLPERSSAPNEPSAYALMACGEILYWSNRLDLPEEERRVACRSSWSILSAHETGAALDAISLCARIRLEGTKKLPGNFPVWTSIARYFPTETAEVCRQALQHQGKQVRYFPNFFDRDGTQLFGYALSVLGEYGNRVDLPYLRGVSDDSRLGQEAIKAIKRIEERLISP